MNTAIATWLSRSDPALLRKLTVFPEYTPDGKIKGYRAALIGGSTQGLALYATGKTFNDAMRSLETTLILEANMVAAHRSAITTLPPPDARHINDNGDDETAGF